MQENIKQIITVFDRGKEAEVSQKVQAFVWLKIEVEKCVDF